MAFGDVLRGLGSVLNPQVEKELAAQDQMQSQLANQVGLMKLQQQIAQNSPQYQAQALELEKKKRADAYFQSPRAQQHLANPDQNAGLRALTADLVAMGVQDPVKFLQEEIAAKKADRVIVPQGAAVLDGGKPVFTNPKEQPKSDLARLIAERDALPPGDPKRKIYDDQINKKSQFAVQVVGDNSTPFSNVQPDGKGGFIGLNKRTGKMESIPADPNLPNATTAPEQMIDAIVSGRMPLPSGFALKSPYWQDVIARVAAKDPNFDATKYGARQAARRTFASGPEARNVTALNTVIGHLGTLDEAATALDNKDLRAFNTVANRLATELGDPRVQNFDTAKQAVAEETMRVFRQVGASEIEARQWGERITASGSPRQLKGVIGTLGKLLESRVEAIGQQYERTVNSTGNPAVVDPKNKKTLDRLIEQGGGAPAWDADKERRYQELLRKRNGS